MDSLNLLLLPILTLCLTLKFTKFLLCTSTNNSSRQHSLRISFCNIKVVEIFIFNHSCQNETFDKRRYNSENVIRLPVQNLNRVFLYLSVKE
jgi:hypothetical protein